MRLTIVMKRILAAVSIAFILTFNLAAKAQQEGAIPTQVLVNIDSKSTPPANASALTVTVDNHKEPLSSWTPVSPAHAQVALLIDDGLRESVGRELDSLRTFVKTLPPGIEILIGYMQNGRVVQVQPFTTDHALAASTLRLPQGVPGSSASPYFCLSDFVKNWPDSTPVEPNTAPTIRRDSSSVAQQKARFVLMISNGVDPYNGAATVTNQDSPYVQAAVTDAQRAGVAVYSIYYSDAGIRGPSADFSGQSYLQQVSQATGGNNYFEGTGNPVSMAPYLKQFQSAVAATYIATFDTPASKDSAKDLVRIKFIPAAKTKLHAPDEVRSGNVE